MSEIVDLLVAHPSLLALPFAGCVALMLAVVFAERVWAPARERYAAFGQFLKYGSCGVIATYVQTGVFYLLAATCLGCLGADDFAVKAFGLPAAAVSDGVRAFRFSAATAVGFVVANLVCWLINRACVFKPGKFRWYVELGMFFAASTLATVIALTLSAALIKWAGLMTTIAVAIEIVVSFFVNFFVRKFLIFKG